MNGLRNVGYGSQKWNIKILEYLQHVVVFIRNCCTKKTLKTPTVEEGIQSQRRKEEGRKKEGIPKHK